MAGGQEQVSGSGIRMKLGHRMRVRGYPIKGDQRALGQAEGTGAQDRGHQVRDGCHTGWGRSPGQG